MTQPAPPDRAQAVIIGGGVIGCSVAYHLADMGFTDIVLLERDKIASGTTWHAAGLMTTFGSMSESSISMRKYSRELYSRLEIETGQATGFKPVGFIEVAADADRLEEFRRIAAFNRWHGIDAEEITPDEILELFPYARLDDVVAGFFVRDDGRVNPLDVTMALAKGARMKGVEIIENCPVTELLTNGDQATGVRTEHGEISAEYVVNCTGMWARQFGETYGAVIPNQAAEHYYLITEQIAGMPKDLPILEDPSCHGYFREEVGGMMVGLFEPNCAAWSIEGVPSDFSFGEIQPDLDRMTPFLERALSRVPVALETGIKKFFCGPESFTPDHNPIVGETPQLRNHFVAAGLNSVGIILGGGLGRALANWIATGRPDIDVTAINVDRFHPYQLQPEYRRRRPIEAFGLTYECHYPDRQMTSARDAKRTPFYDRHAKRGAYFRDVSGWEVPDWFAPSGHEPQPDGLGWRRQNWFEYWAAEHKACRDNVILMDMSFMSKFLVEGRDAAKLLERLSANEVNGDPGKITYTQWLNSAGFLEADVTVIKQSEMKFLVIATDTMHSHVETWMKRRIDAGEHVFVSDVTGRYGQLNIHGPNARRLLQAITTSDLSNDAFPFLSAREIGIGLARVLCTRITYVGELGYELIIPVEQANQVYDRIKEAGEEMGLVPAGLKALSSLRLEKGYRDYGHDIDNTDNPWETGLGFAVKTDRATDFIGKSATILMKAAMPTNRRLVHIFVEDPEPILYHGEVVLRNGKMVGDVRAGSYGHTLGGGVGLAFIEADEPVSAAYLAEGRWEVDIAGKIYPVKISLRPLYDPQMTKVKA